MTNKRLVAIKSRNLPNRIKNPDVKEVSIAPIIDAEVYPATYEFFQVPAAHILALNTLLRLFHYSSM